METKEDLIAALELCTQEETCALGCKILMENCEKVKKITGKYVGVIDNLILILGKDNREGVVFKADSYMSTNPYWINVNKKFIKFLKND